MKEITLEKEKLLKEFSKKYCGLENPGQCSKDQCRCRLMAELRALMNVVLPEGFEHLSIKNFDGQDKESNPILEPKIARQAKEKIVNYCWEDLSAEEVNNMPLLELTKQSIISKRIKNGESVVIHGESPIQEILDSHNERVGISVSPIGRTFVASILTREAIMLRVNGCPELLYDWVEFGALLDTLVKDEATTSNYESCDWLVIDNITDNAFKASGTSKVFSQSKYDAFFYSRIGQGLPTLLIFKFDVESKMKDIESTFGMAIASIIRNKKTCRINLGRSS